MFAKKPQSGTDMPTVKQTEAYKAAEARIQKIIDTIGVIELDNMLHTIVARLEQQGYLKGYKQGREDGRSDLKLYGG